MPSLALQIWTTTRRHALDQLEHAHRSVGGTRRGRRTTTQSINQALCMMLSSQFQAFCRELHDECSTHLVQAAPPGMQKVLELNLIHSRSLDRGNPNPGNIGADFNRFGLNFWDEVRRLDSRNEERQFRLERLNEWRNAIAHQTFDPRRFRNERLRLRTVRSWRSACSQLAESFDDVMVQRLATILGRAPW